MISAKKKMRQERWRVVLEAFAILEKVAGGRRQCSGDIGMRTTGRASVKGLRQSHSRHPSGTGRRPVWPQCSEQGESCRRRVRGGDREERWRKAGHTAP